MTDTKYRVLVVASHPVQYASANFRLWAQHPGMDLTVLYVGLQGAEAAYDPGFGKVVQWDVPLLDGYRWLTLQPSEKVPGEVVQEGIKNFLKGQRFDAVVNFTGYRSKAFRESYRSARATGAAFLFGTDTWTLQPRDRSNLKLLFKKLAWRFVFRLADQVIVTSTPGKRMMTGLGFPESRIALVHNVVNNEWWMQRADQADRNAFREKLGIGPDAAIALFCAKLQEWKRPQDLLKAFASARAANAFVVIAGDGPQRTQLEALAQQLSIGDRVRFLGFQNQSQLPDVYSASDLLVLPSEYEPFGLVVNEAMCCGCPVAVSDQVGAKEDLIVQGKTGFVFSCGDVPALTELLKQAFADLARLRAMGAAARERIRTWSPRENTEAMFAAIEKAVRIRQNKSSA